MHDPVLSAPELLALVPDALESLIFVVDSDGRICALNRAAAHMLGKEPAEVLHKSGGEVFACIHATDAPGGCGRSLACAQCCLRSSLRDLLGGQTRIRKTMRLRVRQGGAVAEFVGVLTGARLCADDGRFRAVLSIDSLDDLLNARSLLPICMACGKIQASEADWRSPADHLESSYAVRFSHGYCPKCVDHVALEFGKSADLLRGSHLCSDR